MTGDACVVLGPGNVSDVDRIDAFSFITEEETSEVAVVDRVTNNTFATAQAIPLGFDAGETVAIDITGELIEPISVGALVNQETSPDPANIPPIDDSSIPAANRINHQTGNPIEVTGTLGNSLGNPNPLADADFFELEFVEAGQTITAHLEIAASVDPRTQFPNSGAVLVLYDRTGTVLQVTDALDIDNNFGDTYLNWVVEETGDFYIAILPYNSADQFRLPSPFRPTTVETGNFTEPQPYTVTIGVDAVDVDYYAVDLNPGDILGLSTRGAANLISLYAPDESLQIRSGSTHSSIYPSNSPLPSDGNADLSYVADQAGTYFIGIEGYTALDYVLESRIFRPAIESAPAGTRQILYLDFDGGEVSPDVFTPGNPFGGIRTVSGLSAFMTSFGLSPSDEDELIDAIISVVDQDFNGDLQRINPNAGVIIKNSRDDGDIFGQPNVSRIVVGGTGAEFLIPTIGIANSVDVGNFDLEEDGIVLLDILSSSNAQGTGPDSLNTFQVAPGASRVDMIAAGIGGVVSHEAGHFFGLFHTDHTNDIPSIMDAGGIGGTGSLDVVGAGQDRIFGTVDDTDYTFATEQFNHDEGTFFGINNLAGNLANVLIEGQGVAPITTGDEIPSMTVSGTIFNDANGNGIRDEGEAGVSGIDVFVDLNNDGEFSVAEPAGVSNAAGSYTIGSIPGVASSLDVLISTSGGQFVTSPASGRFSIAVGEAIPASVDFGVTGNVATGTGVDFSDAPASYGTATHQVQSVVSLGDTIDGDTSAVTNDPSDDGVTISSLTPGSTGTATVSVDTSGFAPGLLTAWLDFDQNGSFSASEQIVSDFRFTGTETIAFDVPSNAVPGTTWARFRYSYVLGLSPVGDGGVGEVEDYPVIISQVTTTPGGGTPVGGGGPTVTVPIAAADSFTLTAGSTADFALLNNDSNGFDATTRIDSVGSASQGGTVLVSADGQTVSYTPSTGFIGTDTFSYTISNSVGTSTAEVTVVVQEAAVTTDGDLVRFRVDVTDTLGIPITNVDPGDEFLLQVFTDDLRPGGAGVYSAYLDVEFDGDLVSTDGPVTFGSDYPAGQVPAGGAILGGASTSELDEFGGFGGFTNEIGPEERLLFSVPMTATQEGIVNFAANPADNLPLHEILLLDIVQPIPEDRIEYGSATLIVGTPQQASFTNLVNPRDVNNDGTVSARDALVVINMLNTNGAGPLNGNVAAVSDGFMVDVNGDQSLSAIDALMIINFLNEVSAQGEAPEAGDDPMATAAAVDAAFDANDDDDDEDDEEEDFFTL